MTMHTYQEPAAHDSCSHTFSASFITLGWSLVKMYLTIA